ncbi:MAG: hypothetical protein UX02_C0001G0312 [Candidatus Moranbacteria bacterium GW2011_GWC1_45_18]|nr:MAG: hypothetical protein UT79_C0002G0085 [Candidatus Moranbacteria bacterium GW2011_GWC2_40_12]KKT33764.1 MAG: hypothetical protein UW19_C0005G0010 [Candidatus Moranbacteria bacterium GW2011_GWF2_44_10]KKU00864.1 MAG: hypothetical protein UX02_C0001G0312 [Candidatus Moranbacteria bacterium GW2011_GWC1_45_18]
MDKKRKIVISVGYCKLLSVVRDKSPRGGEIGLDFAAARGV